VKPNYIDRQSKNFKVGTLGTQRKFFYFTSLCSSLAFGVWLDQFKLLKTPIFFMLLKLSSLKGFHPISHNKFY
jgi:hypothetical protein